MNIVQPIKKIEDIRKIKKYLAKKPRDALLFNFGINKDLEYLIYYRLMLGM